MNPMYWIYFGLGFCVGVVAVLALALCKFGDEDRP